MPKLNFSAAVPLAVAMTVATFFLAWRLGNLPLLLLAPAVVGSLPLFLLAGQTPLQRVIIAVGYVFAIGFVSIVVMTAVFLYLLQTRCHPCL